MAWWVSASSQQHYVRPLSESIAYKVGLQISCGVCTKAKKESALWENKEKHGQYLPRACQAEGMPDYRGTHNAGSCAYAYLHPT